MTLILSMLRCPDRVAPETRRVTGGEFAIGRGPDNDWVLPDPDRVMSKRHCMLAFRSGYWQVADLSSNGTFLNRGTEPIGQGQVQDLRDGDRLRLGAYEIELRIDNEGVGAGSGAALRGKRDDPFAVANPFHEDPFASQPASSLSGPMAQGSSGQGFGGFGLGGGEPLLGGSMSLSDKLAPGPFDPLGLDAADLSFTGPTQADHSQPGQDAFTPPRLATSLLPDDWDLEDIAPPPAPVAAPPPPRAPMQPTPSALDPDPFLDELPAAPPPPSTRAATAPPLPAMAPPAMAPPAMAEAPGLLAAFLEGAGLPDAHPADPRASMLALGRAFRALVSGLRQALIARASIKGEFRIEQTMIRSKGNNPLKFSAGDDDALAALLGVGRRVDMGPAEAVADALRDMRLHELASVSAMQTAVRALLAQLDPAALRRAADQGGGLALVAAQRKARAWDAFEALHATTTQALADDFDSVFGRAFARAYEQALREAQAREERP